MKKSVKQIAISGGAGQIAYQLLFRIASGELFGKDQAVALHILEVPEVLNSLKGIQMELEDCAFPLLDSIIITSDPVVAFQDVDYALLIGAKPRGPGMERKDLLQENGKIFVEQGKALNQSAKATAKVIVVGNPCNTNCLIALHHAPRLDPLNFYAMMRLDQNRATTFLAQKANVVVQEITKMAIWGNHSSTQVPDFFHALVNEVPANQIIKDTQWLENDFMQLVRKRGAAIIEVRGKSSAASAAQSLIDTVKDIESLTAQNHWFSIAKISSGNSYGITENLIFSFPCITTSAYQTHIVNHLELNHFLKTQIHLSEKELLEERELIKHLLKA